MSSYAIGKDIARILHRLSAIERAGKSSHCDCQTSDIGGPTVPRSGLSDEQVRIIDTLERNQVEIMREFDAILRKFEIPRQVLDFRLTDARDDTVKYGWCCCVHVPPKEAPCHLCPSGPVIAATPTQPG